MLALWVQRVMALYALQLLLGERLGRVKEVGSGQNQTGLMVSIASCLCVVHGHSRWPMALITRWLTPCSPP
jgi:hypothetical protein